MESRHNTTQNETIVHATPDTITCARALILLLFAAMLICGTASAIPTCTCNVTQNKDIEANSTGTFTALINCSDTGGINTSRFFMMNTVEGGTSMDGDIFGATRWGLPNRWSIRPPVNNLTQSNGTFPQILRSYNRGKGAWYDNYGIFTDTDYPSRYANFSSDHFSYGVFDNTSIHVTITNGTDWAELNYTWNVEPTAFRNAMFLNLKQLETETKKEYKIYNSNPLLAKFWDIEHMGGTDNYTVCMFNNINYSGSPTENLKLYYCNGSYRTVSEQLPNNGSSDATANMTRNLLLLHFNNESAYGENDTHVYDFSGNGNNGTVIGNAVWSSSAGEFDGAYTFDGIDDYIETRDISHIHGSNPMAIEFWFKTTFNSQTQPIIDAGVVNDADKSLEFWLTAKDQVGLGNNPPINTPGLYWGFWHNDVYIPSVNYYDGNWHHVVVTLYNNTTVEISYDGTRPAGYVWDGLKKTWTYSSQPFTLPREPKIETVPFWIGHSRLQFWQKGNTYFNGTIDEVAVYNRSLSTKEITEHYTRGVIKPVDSPNCVYLGSLSTTDLDDIDYASRNSSYSKFCFGVNNSKIGGINTTDTFYIACESATTTGNYTVRYANGSSGTNVSFNDSKVAWSSTNNVTNWTQAKFTPDLWFASIKSGDIFQLGVYVENNTGRDGNYTNFTLYTDDIGDVNYPITNPSIAWYHSASGGTDSDLDGTHSGNMTIRVEMAEDPNGKGTVNHTLTLRYTDGSLCDTINESFYSPDDSAVDIVFDTENVLNGVYKMNVTATADDDPSDVTSFLTPANFTIDNPTYVNTTGWWRCSAAFNASSIPITSVVENATSGERICVLNGNYEDECVNVNRSHLTLYAKNPYDVNVSAPEPADDHVFNVTAGYVNISGFNVTGATGDDMAGIYLCNADNCNILNNMLSGNTWDIRIENSASVFESNRLNNTTISFTCGGNVSLKGVDMPAGDPPRWNDINRFINATNQSVGAWLFLNFSYYESDVSGLNESDLTIWKYNGTAWVGVGEVYVDSGYNIIGANITNFCPIVPGTVPPDITLWYNNKTNNDTLYLTINESEVVYFNATANQTVTWHWYNNGPVSSNDFDNYTAHWSVNGTKNILVNGTNANGTTNTVNWEILVAVTPENVTNLTNDTPTAHTVNLSWEDPNPKPDVGGYNVYQNGTLINHTTDAFYNVTGLGPNTAYQFNISVYNINGLEGENTSIDVTTAAYSVPAITSWYNNKTNNNATTITINESEVVYFNATANQIVTWHWYNNGSVSSNDFDNYTTSWSVNGTKNILVNGTNANGTTNTVNWTITVVDDTTPPGQVMNLTNSTPTAHTVNLLWDQNPESDVAGYDVYRNGTWIGNTTNTTYNVTGLDPSTPYEFNVSAYDTNENNGKNATVDVTTAAYSVPAITSWYNNKTNNNATTITINESEVVYFNATANQIVTWHWYNNGSVSSNDFDNYTTSWSVNGTKNILVNGTNANGTTNTVNWTITVVDDTTPPVPIDLTSTTGNYWVNYTWSAGSGGGVTDSYNVSNGTSWHNSTDTYYNENVGPSDWLNITVWAYNTSGNGNLSADCINGNVQAPAAAGGNGGSGSGGEGTYPPGWFETPTPTPTQAATSGSSSESTLPPSSGERVMPGENVTPTPTSTAEPATATPSSADGAAAKSKNTWLWWLIALLALVAIAVIVYMMQRKEEK